MILATTQIHTNHPNSDDILSVVKAWVGEISRASYVSTEMIAHGTMSCDHG